MVPWKSPSIPSHTTCMSHVHHGALSDSDVLLKYYQSACLSTKKSHSGAYQDGQSGGADGSQVGGNIVTMVLSQREHGVRPVLEGRAEEVQHDFGKGPQPKNDVHGHGQVQVW